MKAGRFQKDMLFDDEWRNKARCAGMDLNLFFEKYEEDIEVAKRIDNKICLHCPVIKECFNYATKMEEPYKAHGVFGGVFFVDGEISKSRNAHKTQEVWEEILTAVRDDA
jgi:hypothetical protein